MDYAFVPWERRYKDKTLAKSLPDREVTWSEAGRQMRAEIWEGVVGYSDQTKSCHGQSHLSRSLAGRTDPVGSHSATCANGFLGSPTEKNAWAFRRITSHLHKGILDRRLKRSGLTPQMSLSGN
jgi:hypothetical protein